MQLIMELNRILALILFDIVAKVSGFCLDEEIFEQCQPARNVSLDEGDDGLISYRWWPNRVDEHYDEINRLEKKKKICLDGIPVNCGYYVCHYNFYGVYCHAHPDFDYMGDVPFVHPEDLQWREFFNHMHPHHEVANDENIIADGFVVTSTGASKVDLDLSISEDGPDTAYRFSMIPRKKGGKSRVELTTCFVHQNRLKELFGSPVLDAAFGSALVTYCREANTQRNSLHVHKYEVYFPKKHFPTQESYILAQWHGSSNPNFLKDETGCIARISDADRIELCRKGSCKQGKVYDEQGYNMGLRYQQGGYPPLTFLFEDGYFLVAARSDDRVFIPKGGCGRSRKPKTCPQHPRQQLHVLHKMRVKNFPFDSWVQFEWKIVWSEYSAEKMTELGKDPGILLSNAWIRLFMDGKSIVDWVGPCGRNDEKRVPFFKMGMYNPSGSASAIKYYMKNYAHTWTPIQDVTDQKLKDKLATLTIHRKPKHPFSTFNRYTNGEFEKVEGFCTITADGHHLSDVETIDPSRLPIDDDTKLVLKTIVDKLKEQNERISDLEERIETCEKFTDGDEFDIDDVEIERFL